MDHARRRYPRMPMRNGFVYAGLALMCGACGFGGKLELGDNGGNPGVAGSFGSGGSLAGSPIVPGLGGATAVWTQPGAGGAGSVAQGGALPSNNPARPLRMDATGVVPVSSNDFGIEGKWYAYSDELDGGQTRLAGYYEGVVPFVAGAGMCIEGTTQSGLVDNFKTWGAGIGIALDVSDGTAQPLVDPPACFTIVIGADAQYPGDLRADLWGDADAPGQPVNVALQRGSNEVCWRAARVFAPCGGGLECQTPDALNIGWSKINVTAPSASVAGPISFCIEAITPHN